MKHSSGPWRAAIGGENRKPREGEDETEIACLPHYRYDALDVFGPELGRQLTYEELEANARLIAAAPELFNALNLFLTAYDIIDDGPDDSDIAMANGLIVEALSKGKEAVSKAGIQHSPLTDMIDDMVDFHLKKYPFGEA